MRFHLWITKKSLFHPHDYFLIRYPAGHFVSARLSLLLTIFTKNTQLFL